MARQKLRAGELGVVQIMTLPSGRFQARARLCDEVGKVHQLKASGTTAALAETALREKADAVLNDSGGAIASLPTFGSSDRWPQRGRRAACCR